MIVDKDAINDKPGMMKIAIVIERYNPARGGAERSTMEMAAALARAGMKVTIVTGVCADIDDTNRPAGVDIVNLAIKVPRNTWFPVFDRAVRHFFAGGDFDIVHSITPVSRMDVYQPRAGSQLFAMNRHVEVYSGLQRVFKRITAGLNRPRAQRLRAERKLCLDHAGPKIACLSEYVIGQFRSDYDVSQERLVLIRNGIDVQLYKENFLVDNSLQFRQKFDPDDKLAIVLHVSEDPLRKGLAQLIQAVAWSRSHRPADVRPVRLIVVGSYNYTRYQQLAKRFNLDDDVIFFGSTREIPALMKMADALALPTWDDACSRVVMEALAAGTPAISTAFNGASEYFHYGHFGIEIDSPADIEAMGIALNKVADRQICRQMKEAINNSSLREVLSMDRHAAELIKLYQTMKHEQ